MKKMNLVIGSHNHLPIGQDQEIAEKLYQESIKPFLAVLYGYPAFPVVLHYSGVLMEWLEEHHPEFLMLLDEMVERGQVEVLGGGYYDPIITMIPPSDKLGQLEKMTTWLRMHFETRPRGCWLAEEVWEPALASVLRASGLDYTFLSEDQFRLAGATDRDIHQPVIAEDQGKIISIFPVSHQLAGLASAADPEKAIAFLQGIPDRERGPVAVMLVDGLSVPSGIMRNGWLEGFIRLAAENADWLSPTIPNQYLKDHLPSKRLFIPASSPEEMGCHFRQFLTRSPEAWLLYAKMMNTHVLVNQIRGDKYKKKAAQNELWRGQCHNAYWHGARGGLYDNGLRKAVYHSLIEAEKITRATEIFAPSIISADYDMDNETEYLYQGSELNAYIHTRGGSLFELDFLPASWNYLDTIVDRSQPDEPSQPSPIPDGYTRKAFLDHFFEDPPSAENAERAFPAEKGDFLAHPYDLVELNRSLPELLLSRTGNVVAGGASRPVKIGKRFVFRPRSIDVYYTVTNLGTEEFSTRFGVELNISLVERTAESGRIFLLEEDGQTEIDTGSSEIEGVSGLLVRDVRNEVSITVSSAKEFRSRIIPIETKPRGSPEGRPVFQSHCLIPQWTLRLAPQETWENHLSVGFEKSARA